MNKTRTDGGTNGIAGLAPATVSRLEILDAISDATIYHASKALIANPYVLDEEHASEVDRLKQLRLAIMAGAQMEDA